MVCLQINHGLKMNLQLNRTYYMETKSVQKNQ